MSSPLSSSYNKRKDESGDSFLSTSHEDSSYSAEIGNKEFVIDRAIAGLKKCLPIYEEKARICEFHLEKFGFLAKDLPEDLKSDLKEAFNDDDGVFTYPRAGSEMVRVSADHVLASLEEKYELSRLKILSNQMETLSEEFSQLQDNLERKLNSEKEKSEKLENKQFAKEAKLMTFNAKLEAATRELQALHQVSKGKVKPKYNLDDLEILKQEVNKLKTDIAITNIELKKYNNLPLSEKAALKQLEKIKEELKKADDEIRKKVCQEL